MPKKNMRRPSGLLALSFVAAFALPGCGPTQAQGGPPMAPPVSVAPAVARDITLHDEISGRLEATESVEIRARVGGTIERVHFKDGQDVARGALLFSLDARPYAAEVARFDAQLAAAKTAAALTSTELERTKKLLAQNAVSKQEAEQAEANARNAEAQVRAAQAALNAAQLNLGYAHIRAPIAGRTSRTNLTVGNLVAAGEPVLTTIVAQDKVHAWFDLGENEWLAQLKRSGNKPGTIKVGMGLADDTGFPHAGTVDFVDNRLNPATGAIRLRAVFDNKERRFTPGMFARIRLDAGTRTGAVLVPDRAIGTDQSKRFVFVVGDNKLAQFREVRLGPLLEGMRVIDSGLKAGELVVVNGLQRVRPGAPLAPEVLKVDAKGMPIEAPPPGMAPPGAAASAPAKAASK
jgi:RND family efflux transporter MFP subunit